MTCPRCGRDCDGHWVPLGTDSVYWGLLGLGQQRKDFVKIRYVYVQEDDGNCHGGDMCDADDVGGGRRAGQDGRPDEPGGDGGPVESEEVRRCRDCLYYGEDGLCGLSLPSWNPEDETEFWVTGEDEACDYFEFC